MLKDLRASMNGLRTAGESGARTAAAVVTAAETLCRDLEATRNRFGTPQVFESAVSRCCDVLESIANEAETNSESGRSSPSPSWNNFTQCRLNARFTLKQMELLSIQTLGWLTPAEKRNFSSEHLKRH